ncbi:MAG: cytochrome c oxidase subunit 2 [Proteobacteria bacterium]|nr:cytochrome c oxidase subunit 2 [Pseudomonadota bacterium]
MNWLRSILLPAQGTAYSTRVDDLFLFILLVSTFFFLLVVGLIFYFILRYRRRSPGENGTRTINEIHVPVGKPVKLVMSSEDVIHSFYVPSFRIKADVLPNRYTSLWFTPTREGVHLLECAEYCGGGHSRMEGKIHVDTEAKYQDWLENGDQSTQAMPLKDLGAQLYTSRGCAACHSLDGKRGQGPSFKGIWGQTHAMASGSSILVDENYVRRSMLQPQAEIRQGYQGIMPTFQGVLRDREIQALIEFIKSQQ